MTPANAAASPHRPRFGTFGGVFTPCTLTILGVIMFLRLGQVVGRAGVLQAVAIILLANAITLLAVLGPCFSTGFRAMNNNPSQPPPRPPAAPLGGRAWGAGGRERTTRRKRRA